VSRRPARAADLRLARLHLRGGTYALARSELEVLAGADRLDRAGILDLAEVRWRTGDLSGAAAAAAAWLEDADDTQDDGAVLAHAISAEAAAHQGAVGDAAFHVEAAAAGLEGPGALEALLAGIASRAAWPWAGDESGPPPSLDLAGAMVAPTPPAEATAPLQTDDPARTDDPAPAGSAPPPDLPAPALAVPSQAMSAAAAELVETGRELLSIAPDRAAVLLALALRADRAAAEAVLSTLDAHLADQSASPAGEQDPAGMGVTPALAFARAEALRAAGRHEEARMAYASAQSLALAPAQTGPDRSPQ
jgi:hypothetical protein